MNNYSSPEVKRWQTRSSPGGKGRNCGNVKRCWPPALDLFSQKGYHNVSMQEIAEKAEFAIGTLYKFFQNKEDLYKALVLEQCDQFEEALMPAD